MTGVTEEEPSTTTVPVGLPEVKAPVEPVETQPLSVTTCWPSSLWIKAMKSFAASLRSPFVAMLNGRQMG